MFKKLLFLVFIVLIGQSFLTSLAFAQGYNVASMYELADKDAKNGDIIVNGGTSGLIRTDIPYDGRVFGIVQDTPLLVLREASGSGRPVIRLGDTVVNVTDYNGVIKKGDLITSAPANGLGMKATQSGYAVGIALADADLSAATVTINGKSYKTGSVNTALQIEYAEINTSRNTIRLLEELNAALFSSVKNPEKAVLVIRYLIGGLIAMLAFVIGFYSVTRSIGNAVEAIGRNPLARRTILISIGLQILITAAVAIATIVIIFIIIRV